MPASSLGEDNFLFHPFRDLFHSQHDLRHRPRGTRTLVSAVLYKYCYCRRNLVCTLLPTIYLCRLVLLNQVLRLQTQTRGQQQWHATLVDHSPLLSTMRACQTHSWLRYQGGRRFYQRTWHFMSQAYTIVLRQ